MCDLDFRYEINARIFTHHESRIQARYTVMLHEICLVQFLSYAKGCIDQTYVAVTLGKISPL
jgi:hypothetical protein